MDAELFQLPPSGETLVISLWQPWAQWVILGWKSIETRTHPRFAGLAGKRIAIHAAQFWDVKAIEAAIPWLSPSRVAATERWWGKANLTGAILGTVDVTEHRMLNEDDAAAALIECRTRRFGMILRDPHHFGASIPAKGKQGIWKTTLPIT